MMFNKILLTSIAVAGLALTAVNQQFNSSKSTTDQAVKVSGSVNGKTVKTAVSSLDNIKSLETTAAGQEVAADTDTDTSAQETSDSSTSTSSQAAADSSSSSSASQSATTTAVSTQSSTTTTSTAAPAAATTTSTSTSSDASGDINWLIQRESGGNVNAQNGSFYGIGQLSPAAYATYAPGQDYHGNYAVQLQAMQGYIAGRYGSVANAIAHFQSNGWY